MYVERHTVDVTTAADGSATGYTPVVTGRVLSIQYVKDGTTPFSDGVDFDVTGEASTQSFWDEDNVNASKVIAPRQPTHDKAGAASLYAAAGEPVEDYYFVAAERIKVAIASGGDTKLGRFIIHVG